MEIRRSVATGALREAATLPFYSNHMHDRDLGQRLNRCPFPCQKKKMHGEVATGRADITYHIT